MNPSDQGFFPRSKTCFQLASAALLVSSFMAQGIFGADGVNLVVALSMSLPGAKWQQSILAQALERIQASAGRERQCTVLPLCKYLCFKLSRLKA